jgi:hypothetical protein
MIQPNDCGVYPWESAEVRVFYAENGYKAICEFYTLQVGEEWLCAVDCEFKLGDYSSSGEPLSRDRFPHYNRSDALGSAVQRALRFFHTRPRNGCATEQQVLASVSIHNQLQVFAASLTGDVSHVSSGTQFSLF